MLSIGPSKPSSTTTGGQQLELSCGTPARHLSGYLQFRTAHGHKIVAAMCSAFLAAKMLNKIAILTLLLLCDCLQGASATLAQYALYPQGPSGPTPVQSFLPEQGFTLASTTDLSACNKAECDKVKGSISAASVTYCDMTAVIIICICSGAPYDSSRYQMEPQIARPKIMSAPCCRAGAVPSLIT